MNFDELATKIVAGAGVLIGIYLIVSNPKGSSTAENSISGAFNSGVKSLQGR